MPIRSCTSELHAADRPIDLRMEFRRYDYAVHPLASHFVVICPPLIDIDGPALSANGRWDLRRSDKARSEASILASTPSRCNWKVSPLDPFHRATHSSEKTGRSFVIAQKDRALFTDAAPRRCLGPDASRPDKKKFGGLTFLRRRLRRSLRPRRYTFP